MKASGKIAVISMLVLALLISSCSSPTAVPTTAPATISAPAATTAPATAGAATTVPAVAATNSKPITIGYTHYWISPFLKFLNKGVEDKATEIGNITIIDLDAEKDASTQYSQIENLITKKVDVIIIAAVDVNALNGAIADAKAANIPVVTTNMYIDNPNVSAYSGPDDVAAGEMEIENVAKYVGPDAKIVVLDGAPGYSASSDRIKGVHEGLAKYPKMTLLDEQTGNWDRPTAMALMENWIQKYGDQIQAVVSANDDMLAGAIGALQAKGMNNKVFTQGIDATFEAVTNVKNGVQSCTLFQDGIEEGGKAVQDAYDLVTGKTPDNTLIPMVSVCKDDAQKYIDLYTKLGFQN